MPSVQDIPVNELGVYHEVHGTGKPLVLLHGAMSTIETSFGDVLPAFAETRQVIAIEQQAHGHTPDIDRPLSYTQMADDTAALLRELGIEGADVYGYSMGAGIAIELAIRHPGLVRRLVLASLAYSRDGLHPGIVEAIEGVTAEDLAGSVFEEAYAKVAPDPANWAALVAKCNELDIGFKGWSDDEIWSIYKPALVVIGDSDIVRPEHAVQLFRLFGGGVEGESAGLPRSQLAVLPGTTHLTLVERANWLVSMISAFLDDPRENTWTTEHSVETTASPAWIWRLWSDVPTWGDWNGDIERIEISGPFAPGSTIAMTPVGQETVELRIAEASEPELFVDEANLGDVVVRTIHRVDRLDDERSLVTYRMEISGPAADRIGPELGPEISGDFPETLAALVEHAAALDPDGR
jgi:pimeloyl-ACP methyl ester carboxylesterase